MVSASPPFLPPPSITAPILSRQRLLARMASAAHCRVILVVAPAGYGKTTLLADFAAQSNVTIAWCCLDHSDRDPVTLLDHLHSALVCQAHSPNGAISPDAVLARFCAELSATLTRETLLVLDDVHHIAHSAGGQTLDHFLDHAPPRLRVCLLSRTLPEIHLPRRRARQELLEITAADLAFSDDEITQLFTVVYDLVLDRPTLDQLTRRTQGWIAALVLLRDSLRRLPAKAHAAFLQQLGFSDDLYTFLADEMWRRRPRHIRQFLMQTAILDPVTPSAATALTGKRTALDILARAERAGLFVTREDPQSAAYRYHPLLREFLLRHLRDEFGEQAIFKLYRRAAKHFHATGAVEIAIEHALAGHDWTRAATWIESVAENMLQCGRLVTLVGWINLLSSPTMWLILTRGRAQFLLGQCASGEADVALALARFQARRDQRGIAAAHLARGTIRFRRGDYDGAMKDARAVLAHKSLQRECAEASDWLGGCLVETGHPQRAEKYFAEALTLHCRLGNVGGQALAIYHLSVTALLRGDLSESERLACRALESFRALGDYRATLPLLRLTEIHHLRGEEDRAVETGGEALRLAEEMGLRLTRAYALAFRADALAALGEVARAEADYREALARGDESGEPFLRILPLIGLSRVALARGRPDAELDAELERRTRATRAPALCAPVFGHLGDLAAARGDARTAKRYWRAAEKCWRQLGTEYEIVALQLRQAEHAGTRWRSFFRRALALANARGYDFIFARTERQRALPLLVAALVAGIETESAQRILVQLGAAAVAPLVAQLDRARPAAKPRVVAVLGEIGDRQVAPRLRQLESDADPIVRAVARAARKHIASDAPASLRLLTLGQFEVERDGVPINGPAWQRKAVRRLFKILIAQRGQVVGREVLDDLLWPEAQRRTGLKRLKALVHLLRHTLEPDLPRGEPSSFVALVEQGYVFRLTAAVWLDSDEFVTRVRHAQCLAEQGLSAEALMEYGRADDLYRGDFLAEDLYEDWCALERESLREMHLQVLDALGNGYLARHEDTRAAGYFHRSVAADPLRESAHRGLMIALARRGCHAEALRQFQTCREILRDEIGMEPMPETRDLYQRLMRQETL